MKPAQYAVIRYIADAARNEPRNVGILAWNDEHYRLRIDEAAAARVVREHPWLEQDALRYLEPHLREQLDAAFERAPVAGEAIAHLLQAQKGYPILVSEPRHTTIVEEGPEGLEQTTDRLVQRLVTPRRRGSGGGPSPVHEIARHLRPFIARGLVEPNYSFPMSRSGVPRTVDFFANSTANVAIDVVRLAVQDANAIRVRADAEAFKVEDIRGANEVGFVAYCQVGDQPELQEVLRRAFQVLTSAGAEVVTTPAAAAERLRRTVGV